MPLTLNNPEMYKLIQAAYPEQFPNDDETTWESVQSFLQDIGDPKAIADLLGRVVLMTPPTPTENTDVWVHRLGRITAIEGGFQISVAVERHENLDPPEA